LYNLRLKELVAIVKENKLFYDEFVEFLHYHGYGSILAFIQEQSDEKAKATIIGYLAHPNKTKLYDGLLRPYTNSKAKWYFLAWLLREVVCQELCKISEGVTSLGETEIRLSFRLRTTA
jgi:hypothetical protein